jgi:hypothetical protein
MEVKCSRLNLVRWEETKKLWGVNLAGICDAEVSFSGDPRQWWSGEGKASVKIENGLAEGIARYLLIPVDKLEGCTLNADLTLSGGKATIKQGAVVCRQGRADLQGMIVPRSIPAESRLDLTANITLAQDLQKDLRLPFDRIRITIKGTPSRPIVNFVTGKGGRS